MSELYSVGKMSESYKLVQVHTVGGSGQVSEVDWIERTREVYGIGWVSEVE